MKSDFCRQFIICCKSPVTWKYLNNRVNDVKLYLIEKGLDPEDFCVTDDPTKEKRLRIDLGITSALKIDEDVCDHLRKIFVDLYFIE